jgi:hypothetical protein
MAASALEKACYIHCSQHGKPMNNKTRASSSDPVPDRWTLIRDIAVLQVKLVVDSFRDIVLVPVSLIAGAASLIKGGERPAPHFYDLLRVGKQSEHWINLFGAADHVQGSSPYDDRFAGQDIDSVVSKVEAFVIDEYKKGGVTAQAKEHLDKVLNSVSRNRTDKKSSPNE